MGLPTFIKHLFEGKAKKLAWEWIPATHVFDADDQVVAPAPDFVAKQDYIVLRLSEMYLRTIRVLWRERYPVVHSFITYGDVTAPRTATTVAGPGQLKDLGSTNLDRLIGLSYRLAGPIVYDGQGLEVLAGLYAIPAKDGARVLLETLSQLSGLVPTLGQVAQLGGVLSAGVEGLLGIDKTELQLAIHDTLRTPRPGFAVAINAEAKDLDVDRLWVKEGRLYEGDTLQVSELYAAYDMMLFELHRGASRAAAYGTLPALAAINAELDEILRQTADVDQLKAKLNAAYRSLDLTLGKIEDLTDPDKKAILGLVAADLKDRVSKLTGPGVLFETRSLDGIERKVEVRSFQTADLLIPDDTALLPQREFGLDLFS